MTQLYGSYGFWLGVHLELLNIVHGYVPCCLGYDQPKHIKNQRHYFANKGPSSQGNGFSSGHVWM